MIELRWREINLSGDRSIGNCFTMQRTYHTKTVAVVLQYRQKTEFPPGIIPPTNAEPNWTDWQDVPMEVAE